MTPQERQGKASPARRSPWEVQRGVLFALLLREMKARVGGQWVGAVWTLIEPLTHMLMLVTIISVVSGRGGMFPGLEYPVFLVTGLVPYFLFLHLYTRLMEGIDANRGMFSYRQVKPFDTLVSRAIVEALMNLMVYTVTLGVLGWLGYHVLPASPLAAMGVHLLIFLLGSSLGTLAAVVTHDRPRLRSFLRMLTMPLYIGSGILFPIHAAPPELLHWLLFNPLLHLIELSRHAFIPHYEPLAQVSLVYASLFTLTVGALALLMYRADRLRLVTST